METNQQSEENLRRELEAMIEAARAEIESAMAQMPEGVERSALSDQISSLDGQLAAIQFGNGAQLAALQISIPRTINNVYQKVDLALARASAEQSLHVGEMTSEAIYELQQSHDRESVAFNRYEARSHSRIEHQVACHVRWRRATGCYVLDRRAGLGSYRGQNPVSGFT